MGPPFPPKPPPQRPTSTQSVLPLPGLVGLCPILALSDHRSVCLPRVNSLLCSQGLAHGSLSMTSPTQFWPSGLNPGGDLAKTPLVGRGTGFLLSLQPKDLLLWRGWEAWWQEGRGEQVTDPRVLAPQLLVPQTALIKPTPKWLGQ